MLKQVVERKLKLLFSLLFLLAWYICIYTSFYLGETFLISQNNVGLKILGTFDNLPVRFLVGTHIHFFTQETKPVFTIFHFDKWIKFYRRRLFLYNIM